MGIFTPTSWDSAVAGMAVEQREVGLVDEIVIQDYADLMVFPSEAPWMQVAGNLPHVLESVQADSSEGKLSFTINEQAKALSGSLANRMTITRSNQPASPDRVLIGIGLPHVPSICISGAGDVSAAGVDQATLVLKVQGTGNIQVEGRVGALQAVIEGAGNVDAKNLIAKSVDLNVLGSGNIHAHADLEATVEISGTGTILVRGNPGKRSHIALSTGKIVFED